jgi:hypothetical protein
MVAGVSEVDPVTASAWCGQGSSYGGLSWRNCCGGWGGLALLLHVGLPQSKEGDDRMEAKIDALLLAVDPGKGERKIRDIDGQYEGRHTTRYACELRCRVAQRAIHRRWTLPRKRRMFDASQGDRLHLPTTIAIHGQPMTSARARLTLADSRIAGAANVECTTTSVWWR